MKKIVTVRPKANTELAYMGECFVSLNIRQRWQALVTQDIAIVRRRGVTLKLKLLQYKMFFKEVNEDD